MFPRLDSKAGLRHPSWTSAYVPIATPDVARLDWLQAPGGLIDETAELATAVTIALCTDALADVNDIRPDPNSTDRRGWWADHKIVLSGNVYLGNANASHHVVSDGRDEIVDGVCGVVTQIEHDRLVIKVVQLSPSSRSPTARRLR